ncbi:hypothetical protein HO133_001167 [Letharia lupina]|uniref:Uncharacterized protein n=2 Tax=Letharia TaxID=112415 RepID=A0A8H6FBI8_9LECA|nr:uncharacterized protein HO133_001167 [Letharia lupina]XP_037161302.1 uncharacterized protein HO173_009953 [Letharia columbiana]KAF6222081.1 hypothetical protein HO133_001167 [Letharia lupina]KAF6231870.1 hypothetical protein HO173_009953 [Letharia columbiana]
MEQPNKPYGFPAREILIPALKVGALSGTTGILYGSVAGVLRSAHPILFAVAAGIQWSALGSTFWATRATILHTYYPSPSQKDRLTASTFAGGITGGTIGGLFRGPRNVIPGTIMFTLFGYIGQTVYDALDARHTAQVASEAQAAAEGKKADRKRFWEWFAEMKWSPLTVLSDEDYGNMLKEKLLRVEAEIALVDEEVDRLRREERRMEERQGKEPSKSTT